MEIKFIEEKEKFYNKTGEYGAAVILEIDGVKYETTFMPRKKRGVCMGWFLGDIKRVGGVRKSRFKDEKVNSIIAFLKEHYQVNDDTFYIKVFAPNEEAIEKHRKEKIMYNRVKNYGWDRTTAKETPIRKKKRNNIHRKYDVIRGDGFVLHEGLTLEEAARKLKIKRATARSYTGYKWREKIINRGKGIYLTESEKQQ